eukprot:COSAG01_NODE_495_length_16308_cov_92.317088_8_plen_70_part_00
MATSVPIVVRKLLPRPLSAKAQFCTLEHGAVPKGSALFINQGGYEAGYIRHLSISNLTGDAPNHTYEHG